MGRRRRFYECQGQFERTAPKGHGAVLGPRIRLAGTRSAIFAALL